MKVPSAADACLSCPWDLSRERAATAPIEFQRLAGVAQVQTAPALQPQVHDCATGLDDAHWHPAPQVQGEHLHWSVIGTS